jgi:uncharacterized protein
MSSAEGCVVAVFAKAVAPGAVKTRLIGQLGATGAARLHVALVRQALRTALEAGVGRVELWTTQADNVLRDLATDSGIAVRLQCPGDLGQRMAHAFDELLRIAAHVILIGSDCPSRSAQDLRETAALLNRGYDAVLGPTEDGGYHLIGLNRVQPSLFTNIEWSTPSVIRHTRARLHALALRWFELPLRWDVDRPEDLARLREDSVHAALIEAAGDVRA